MNKKINDIFVYDAPELITEFSQGYLLKSYNDKDKILSLLKIIDNNSEYYAIQAKYRKRKRAWRKPA